MPATNGPLWRECREDMGLTSDVVAGLLGISGGHLRQIELEVKPASGRLASAAARLYRVPKQDLFKAAEGKPAKPQPKVEPVAPRPRPDRETRKTGPKRVRTAA